MNTIEEKLKAAIVIHVDKIHVTVILLKSFRVTGLFLNFRQRVGVGKAEEKCQRTMNIHEICHTNNWYF